MMKKLLALLLSLLLTVGCACAETATKSLTVPELNMSIEIPVDAKAVTRSSSLLDYLRAGLDQAFMQEYMEVNDTYAVVVPADFAWEIDVSMAPNDAETFDDLSALELNMVGMALKSVYAGMGVTLNKYETYSSPAHKYLRIFYTVEQEGVAPTEVVQYYTIQNYQAINFRLYLYSGTDEALMTMYQSVVDSAVYAGE